MLVAALAVPILVSGIALAVKGWQPVGEMAMAELRLRGFWSHPPDLGAVARIRVGDRSAAHPGPIAYWLLYPVYALLGRSPAGLTIAVATAAAAWLGAGVVLVARRAGTAAAALLTATWLLFAGGLGVVVVTQPWNPWLAIFPFTFLVLAAWDVVEDHPWSLVGVALAGSVCVQSHFSYVPGTAALGLVAVVAALVHAARQRAWRRLAAPAAGAVVTALLAWTPALVQQLRGDPGNLALLWRGWNDSGLPAAGLRTSLRVVAYHLDPFGNWLTGGEVLTRHGLPVGTVLLAVAVVGAMAVAWRRRSDPSWRAVGTLLATLTVTVLAAVVGISRTTGNVYDYLVAWVSALTAAYAFALAWAAWLVAAPALLRAVPKRTVSACAAVAVVVLSGWTTVRLHDPPVPDHPLSTTVDALAPQLERVIDPDDRYLVRWTDPVDYGAVGFGLTLRLERDGYDVGVDPTYRVEAMPTRVRRPEQADRTLWIVSGDSIEAWRQRRDVEEVASYDPRPATDRDAAAAGHQALVRHLTEIGGPELASRLATNHWDILGDPRVDEATKREVLRLAGSGLPTAVFLGPADAADLPGGATAS